jgi:CRP/FNR family transcriptional regulator, cyclic AMP receptor protein
VSLGLANRGPIRIEIGAWLFRKSKLLAPNQPTRQILCSRVRFRLNPKSMVNWFVMICVKYRHSCTRMWFMGSPVPANKKKREFDPQTFLATIGEGRKNLTVGKKEGIFAQGDEANAVFYIQSGKVKLTVVSKTGREATIGMLSEGNFFGEGALAGQALRMGSASAITDCELMRVDKKAMMQALHREHTFSDMFVAYLLARNIRYEEDLVDQLFNSSEKRLARVLLLLAHFGKEGTPETVVPKISQESLAEMVGTTRSRVSFFMNRFRKLGFIHYAGGIEGGLQVHSSLLNVVLHD